MRTFHYLVIEGGVVVGRAMDRGEVEPETPAGWVAVAPEVYASADTFGGTFDGTVYTPAAPAPTTARVLSHNEFLDRFTEEEEVGLSLLQIPNPPAIPLTLTAAAQAWNRRFLTAKSINLDDPRLVTGLTHMADGMVLLRIWTDQTKVTRIAEIRA